MFNVRALLELLELFQPYDALSQTQRMYSTVVLMIMLAIAICNILNAEYWKCRVKRRRRDAHNSRALSV
jgi:hypothetical protein